MSLVSGYFPPKYELPDMLACSGPDFGFQSSSCSFTPKLEPGGSPNEQYHSPPGGLSAMYSSNPPSYLPSSSSTYLLPSSSTSYFPTTAATSYPPTPATSLSPDPSCTLAFTSTPASFHPTTPDSSVAPLTHPIVSSTPSLVPSITPSLAPALTPTLTPSLTPSLAPSLAPYQPCPPADYTYLPQPSHTHAESTRMLPTDQCKAPSELAPWKPECSTVGSTMGVGSLVGRVGELMEAGDMDRLVELVWSLPPASPLDDETVYRAHVYVAFYTRQYLQVHRFHLFPFL